VEFRFNAIGKKFNRIGASLTSHLIEILIKRVETYLVTRHQFKLNFSFSLYFLICCLKGAHTKCSANSIGGYHIDFFIKQFNGYFFVCFIFTSVRSFWKLIEHLIAVGRKFNSIESYRCTLVSGMLINRKPLKNVTLTNCINSSYVSFLYLLESPSIIMLLSNTWNQILPRAFIL